MRYNSRNKKRGSGFEKISSKKRNNMKSPFTITVIVLILFAVLVVFSVFNGPIEKDDIENVNVVDENIQRKEFTLSYDPMGNVNLAISSNDISKCNGDEECENWFYSATSKETLDCDRISNEELRDNCIGNIYFDKAIENNDKTYCDKIKNVESRNACIEELK